MSLVSMKEMLDKTCRDKYAVGNSDVFNTEMITGVIDDAYARSGADKDTGIGMCL